MPDTTTDDARTATRANRPRNARPSMIVIVDEATLTERLAHAGVATTLDGMPISVAEARRLACAADIIPVVLGGDGRILDVGRKRRWVTDAQWVGLIARDRGCVIKGCATPVAWTEAHHATPWELGGPTTVDNLCLLCPAHHRQLHHLGWNAHLDRGKVHIADATGAAIATKDPPPGHRRAVESSPRAPSTPPTRTAGVVSGAGAPAETAFVTAPGAERGGRGRHRLVSGP